MALESMRADGDTYYFNVYDTNYRMLMHPFRKELIGQDMKDFRTDDGVRVYYDQIGMARLGGGFVSYQWAKPGTDKVVEKVAYAGMYAPWNWVISSGVYMDDVQQQALVFTAIMAATGGGVVLIVLALSWLIGNRITLPLRQATHVAESIARGKLDSRIGEQAHDEPGRLLESMARMQEQLHAVISGQREMASRHDAGNTGYRMDETAFPGEYGLMVHETNALVGAHVQTMDDVLAVVQRYAQGDLGADIARYPGEKAEITRTVDAVKQNLGSINGEIQRLASAAAAGDFSQRGDTTRFDHDFRRMIGHLNAMMQVSDENLGKLSQLLSAIAEGDLTARMQGDFQGVFATMRDDANATVAQLTQIVGQIRGSRRQHQPGRRRNRHRQQRPVAPYRTAGRQPGRNRRLDGGTDLHRAPERRARTPGQPARDRRALRRLAGRQRRRRSGHHHGRDPDLLEEDRRDHLGHRRHRVPDQHPGIERCGGSRTRR